MGSDCNHLKVCHYHHNSYDQFSSATQLCPTLCDPINLSAPGLPVHHQLREFIQTHVCWVSDAIQPSHPLLSPSSPALSLFQHQGLFKWVGSLHQVAKVLEFQLQHQVILMFKSHQLEMGIFRSRSILGIWGLWNMWLDPWGKDFKTVGLLSIHFFTQEGKKMESGDMSNCSVSWCSR